MTAEAISAVALPDPARSLPGGTAPGAASAAGPPAAAPCTHAKGRSPDAR